MLTYLNVPRTMFTVTDGKPSYDTIKTQYECPFCGEGIAGDEKLAAVRLKEGWKRVRQE